MDDDRLASELRRRAGGAAPQPDWAQRDLLPAVWHEIDARPQPVLASRWSPLASLVTLVIALLILVVAVPRLVPAPPPAATSVPSVVEPSVLDCGQLPTYAYEGVPASTVNVVDSTGLIDSCSTEIRQGTWPDLDTQAFVAGVAGQDAVEVAWNMQHCGPESVSVRVSSQGDKYAITLVLDRLSAGGAACVDTITSKHVVLRVPSASVAGLAAAPVSLAILAPSDDLTIRPTQVECSPEPGAAADAPHTTLYDDTHLVTSCEAVEPGGGAFLTAANPNGDERVVDVNWSATPCEAAPTVHVGKLSNGYFVHGALPKAPCSQPAVAQTLRLHLNAAITAGDVIVQFDPDGPTTSGGPPARVACTDAPDVTIVDVLGVIQSCSAADGQVSPEEGFLASNPGGNKNVLQIAWLGPSAPCNYEVHLTKPDEHYNLDIYEMDDACRQANIGHSVNLQLMTPIDAAQITGFSMGGAPGLRPSLGPSPATTAPTSRPVECYAGLLVVDETGLVQTCTAIQTPAAQELPVSVSNPDGDQSRLEITWAGCNGPNGLTLRPTVAGYELVALNSRPIGVICDAMLLQIVVQIQLSAPIDAGTVTISFERPSFPPAPTSPPSSP